RDDRPRTGVDQLGSGTRARPSTTSAWGSAVSDAGGTSSLRSRDPPPTITRSQAMTAASIQIGRPAGRPYGVTPPICMPVMSVVSSPAANDAFFTPNLWRPTPFTSRRVEASTRHAAWTRGSDLPTTMIALADWSSGYPYASQNAAVSAAAGSHATTSNGTPVAAAAARTGSLAVVSFMTEVCQ